VAIEYRGAETNPIGCRCLAADLVRRRRLSMFAATALTVVALTMQDRWSLSGCRWLSESAHIWRHDEELVGLQPDIILTNSIPPTVAPPAGDADDPDRLYVRERPRRQRHHPAA
jgi:hypothetical protein